SPVIQAGRDVHFNVPIQPPVKDEDAEAFAELEQTMPDLLNDLRRQLSENPLIRNIVISHPSRWDNYSTNWIRFLARDNPKIQLKLNIWKRKGWVRRITKENEWAKNSLLSHNAFGMSEKLVRSLKRGKAGPDGSGPGG